MGIVLNWIVQGVMVAAAAGIGLWLLPAGRARARVQVWWTVVAAVIALPLVTWWSAERQHRWLRLPASARSHRAAGGRPPLRVERDARWPQSYGSRGFACKACGFPSTFARWRAPGAPAFR